MTISKNSTAIAVTLLLFMLLSVLSLPALSKAENEAVNGTSNEEKEAASHEDEEALQDPYAYSVTYERVYESVPYETLEVPSNALPYNERQLVTKGSDGEMVKTYEVRTYPDGKVSRVLIGSDILTPVVNEEICYGCERSVPYNEFIYPTVGRISSGYGRRTLRGVEGTHYGLDIANKLGSAVNASDSGVVKEAGEKGTYGLCVIIDHQNGFVTCYAHLSKIEVDAGQEVVRGEEIGKTGSTGNATGNHLHFEIRVENVKVDPLLYLTGELSEK